MRVSPKKKKNLFNLFLKQRAWKTERLGRKDLLGLLSEMHRGLPLCSGGRGAFRRRKSILYFRYENVRYFISIIWLIAESALEGGGIG